MPTWLLLVTIIAAPQTHGKSVAMVLDTAGNVVLRRAGEDAKRPPLMTLLMENDKLVVGEKSQATLMFFQSRQRVRIKAEATVEVDAQGCQPAEAAIVLPSASLLAGQDGDKLKKLAVSGKGGAITVRGGAEVAVPVVEPIHGATTLSLRPDFHWQEIPEVDAYRVILKQGIRGRVWQAETAKPPLRYPDVVALKPGRTYQWEVSARTKNGKSRILVRAEFGTASQTTIETLDALSQFNDSDDPAVLLSVAAVYHQHGVYDHALRLYERLAALKPAEPFVRAALADCYEKAGRLAEAEAAHERAEALGWTP